MENIFRLPRTIRFLLMWGLLLTISQSARADCITITLDTVINATCGMDNGSVVFSVAINLPDCSTASPCNGTTASIQYQLNKIGGAAGTIETYSSGNPDTIVGLEPGNYTLVIYHFGPNPNTPCDIATENLTILGGNLTVTPSNILSSGCTTPTGSFTITVTGGTGPYTVTATGSNPSTTINMTGVASTTSFSNLAAQTYTVTASNGSCMSTATVTVPPIFVVNLQVTAQPVRCNGGSDGSVQITQPPATGNTFSISPAMGTFNYPTFSSLVANNNYIITATNTASGCSATVTANVTQPDTLTVGTTVINISCQGLTDGMINTTVTGGNSGSFTYVWSHSASATTGNLTNLAPGTYTVTVTDSKGCFTTASSTVTEDAGADFTINYTPEITSGGSPNIKPIADTTGFRFNWNIVEAINATITPTPNSTNTVNNNTTIPQTLGTIDMRSPGVVVYHIQIEKSSNPSCKGKADTISVLIRPDTGNDPFIPEIYTPNGDGQNDVWLVVMPDGVEKGDYTIFNRLGGKVHEGDTLSPWDGTGCPDGPYFYVLRYMQNDAEKVKKGAITILRTSR